MIKDFLLRQHPTWRHCGRKTATFAPRRGVTPCAAAPDVPDTSQRLNAKRSGSGRRRRMRSRGEPMPPPADDRNSPDNIFLNPGAFDLDAQLESMQEAFSQMSDADRQAFLEYLAGEEVQAVKQQALSELDPQQQQELLNSSPADIAAALERKLQAKQWRLILKMLPEADAAIIRKALPDWQGTSELTRRQAADALSRLSGPERRRLPAIVHGIQSAQETTDAFLVASEEYARLAALRRRRMAAQKGLSLPPEDDEEGEEEEVDEGTGSNGGRTPANLADMVRTVRRRLRQQLQELEGAEGGGDDAAAGQDAAGSADYIRSELRELAEHPLQRVKLGPELAEELRGRALGGGGESGSRSEWGTPFDSVFADRQQQPGASTSSSGGGRSAGGGGRGGRRGEGTAGSSSSSSNARQSYSSDGSNTSTGVGGGGSTATGDSAGMGFVLEALRGRLGRMMEAYQTYVDGDGWEREESRRESAEMQNLVRLHTELHDLVVSASGPPPWDSIGGDLLGGGLGAAAQRAALQGSWVAELEDRADELARQVAAVLEPEERRRLQDPAARAVVRYIETQMVAADEPGAELEGSEEAAGPSLQLDEETLDRLGLFMRAAANWEAYRAYMSIYSDRHPELNLRPVMRAAGMFDNDEWWAKLPGESEDPPTRSASTSTSTSATSSASSSRPVVVDWPRVEAVAALDTDCLAFMSELEATGYSEETFMKWYFHPVLGPRIRSGSLLDPRAVAGPDGDGGPLNPLALLVKLMGLDPGTVPDMVREAMEEAAEPGARAEWGMGGGVGEEAVEGRTGRRRGRGGVAGGRKGRAGAGET